MAGTRGKQRLTRPEQSGPFPGFSMDHFNYGLQMGADDHGTSNHPWESPFQNPYMSDSHGDLSGTSMSPASGMGMGGQPPMDPSMGMAPPGMMGGMPQGMPMGGGMPQDQQQGPSPYGVWGDQDLANDPAYAGAAATQHPKWNRFLQYMNTPEARDSMMLGVIMSRMGTDPQGTMQLAMQFREHQNQRAFQAQQGELNREAQQENIKLRGEYMKQQKDEASQRTLGYKIDQSRKDLANEGVEPGEMPDDPAAWPVYQEDLRNQLAKAKSAKAEEKKVEAKRKQAFSEASKTGVVPDAFSEDAMVQAAAQTANDRNLRANERLEIQKRREAQLRTIRANKATLPDVKLQAQQLHTKITSAEKDIDRYEQNIAKIEGNGIYAFLPEDSAQKATFDRMIERYQKSITDLETKRDDLETKWDALVETRGEARPDSEPPKLPAGTSIKDVAPSGTSPQGDNKYLNLGDNAPTEKAKKGFAFAYSKAANPEVKKMLADEWKRRYGADPELP